MLLILSFLRVPVEFRRVVYCSGVRLGGQEAWDFCLKRFLAANVAAERENLINALGCTKNTVVLEKYNEFNYMHAS
jgi:aminopeptidase N